MTASAAAAAAAGAVQAIDPNAAFARAADEMARATRAAAGAVPAATSRQAATAGLGRDSSLDEAAQALASDLRAVPGIERFGKLRLGELERSGPRPLRTMWRIARDQLDERYGNLTIGEMIDRYTGSGGPSASA